MDDQPDLNYRGEMQGGMELVAYPELVGFFSLQFNFRWQGGVGEPNVRSCEGLHLTVLCD